MFNEKVCLILQSLDLALDSINFSALSRRVSVGVRNRMGTRWLGHSEKGSQDPSEDLNSAFEDALNQFDTNWRAMVERAVQEVAV